MQIVTGYAGESHITSNDDQGRNQGIFGTSSYVLNVGSKFEITTVSANEYQIADGEAVHQGVHFRVDPNSYDTITIDSGTQGMYRKDLIVARYTKSGSTGVETMAWVVIKGTPSSSSAAVPSYTSGDILNGDYTADMPMYVITLNGINVSSVTAQFSVVPSLTGLQGSIATTNASITSLSNTVTGKVSDSVKVLSDATDGSKVGFNVEYSSTNSFVIFLTTSTGVVALLTKQANHDPTMAILNGSFDASALTSTNSYLRVGNWARAMFVVASQSSTLANITISTYTS